MTIHMISVGLSIRDALDNPRGHNAIRSNPDLRNALLAAKPFGLLTDAGVDLDNDHASDWITTALTATTSSERASLTDLITAAFPVGWPPGISAELDTFDRVTHGPLAPTDIAVLICTDTPRGMLAGLWNAIALTRTGAPGTDPLERVSFLTDPAASLPSLRGQALIVRTRGMDAALAAASDAGINAAMRDLGKLAGNLVRHGEVAEDEPVRCYLSGGYKATIPYLIGMTEGIRSLPGGRHVEAVVLHEESASAAVRLPLRRIDPDLVKQELAGFTNGSRQSRPDTAFLEGYAYERHSNGRQWTLTSFGEGLLALFGTAIPGLF